MYFPGKLFIITLVLVTSCGKGTDLLSGPEDPQSTPGSVLQGTWTGFVKEKNSLLSSPTPVVMTIGSTDFHINFSESNTHAKGTFETYAGKNIVVTLSESSVSAFGLSSKVIDFLYELEDGDKLRLHNDEVEYLVNRRAKGNDSEAKKKEQDGAAEEAGLRGVWTCEDNNRNQWNLTIQEAQTFKISVTKPNMTPLWLYGRISEQKADGWAKLHVEKDTSLRESYVGTEIDLHQTSTKTLMLSLRDPRSLRTASQFACHRYGSSVSK